MSGEEYTALADLKTVLQPGDELANLKCCYQLYDHVGPHCTLVAVSPLTWCKAKDLASISSFSEYVGIYCYSERHLYYRECYDGQAWFNWAPLRSEWVTQVRNPGGND